MKKNLLKAKVAEKGLTYKELARKLGMKYVPLENRLREDVNFTLPELVKLKKVLELTPDEFNNIFLDDWFKKFFTDWDNLTKDLTEGYWMLLFSIFFFVLSKFNLKTKEARVSGSHFFLASYLLAANTKRYNLYKVKLSIAYKKNFIKY